MRKSVVVTFFFATVFFVVISWGENLSVLALAESSSEMGIYEKASDNNTINKDKEAGRTEPERAGSEETLFINTPVPEIPHDETARNVMTSGSDVTEKVEAEQSEPEPEMPYIYVKDPLEPFNRAMFTFNDKAFHYFFKPIYTGYNSMVPEKARVSVRNFYTNIKMPVRFFNCLFQANFKGAGTEMLRFVINSTVGVAGFFDPAKSKFHIEKQDRDFGQTLGKYKMESGTYFVWPFIGPSNTRDTIGLLGDGALNPITWISFFFLTPIESLGNYSYDTINDVSIDKGNTYESITKPAIDPYIALQDAYTQNRIKKIKESPDYNETID
ncbi:MAG: VacJ family lipoprotein [Candidatus Brocadia sp.]|jgi:phospholipid-binding lipoprotein MlaA